MCSSWNEERVEDHVKYYSKLPELLQTLVRSVKECCGLNVCVSPKFLCSNPNLQGDGI